MKNCVFYFTDLHMMLGGSRPHRFPCFGPSFNQGLCGSSIERWNELVAEFRWGRLPRFNVWYIYLHEWLIFLVNVEQHTIGWVVWVCCFKQIWYNICTTQLLVTWWVWRPGGVDSDRIPEHERDCYLEVTLESQTSNPNHQFTISI